MIKVTIVNNPKTFQISRINITGHANAKKSGDEFDAICAAVSAISFGILNKLAKDEFKGELVAGDNLIVIGDIDLHSNPVIDTVIDTMLVQLKTIEEIYSKHLKLTYLNGHVY